MTSKSLAECLYLPRNDRSFWRENADGALPLAYLAWGRRDFHRQHIPMCTHRGWSCFLIEEGAPRLLVRDKSLLLNTGDMVVVGPQCPFGWDSVQLGECRLILWLWKGFFSYNLLEIGLNAFKVKRLTKNEVSTLQMIHSVCRQEVCQPDERSQGSLQGAQKIFEAHLERILFKQSVQNRSSDMIRQAMEWMESHLDSQAPIARLCDYLSISPSTLRRMFRSRLNSSAADYFQMLKMEKAQELLQDPDRSVKSVAIDLGYEHFNDFSRAYRNYFDCSPRSIQKLSQAKRLCQV